MYTQLHFPTNINQILDSTARDWFRTPLFEQRIHKKILQCVYGTLNELETKYEITRMIVFSYKTIFMLVSILIYNIDLPVGTTPIRGYSRCSQNCLKHEWSTLIKTKRKSYE